MTKTGVFFWFKLYSLCNHHTPILFFFFIQDSLPKTSYFKTIDWILLLSVNSQIVIMVFHTYMYWACQDEFNMHRYNISDSFFIAFIGHIFNSFNEY